MLNMDMGTGGFFVGGNVITKMEISLTSEDLANKSTLFDIDVSIYTFREWIRIDQVTVRVSTQLLERLCKEVYGPNARLGLIRSEASERLAAKVIPGSVRRNYGC